MRIVVFAQRDKVVLRLGHLGDAADDEARLLLSFAPRRDEVLLSRVDMSAGEGP